MKAFVQAGQIAEALALVEAGLKQSDGSWFTPEWLRLKREISHCRVLLQSRKRRRITSGSARMGKVRCPGNSALLRASPACGATGTASVRRAICWRRFMAGLSKDLTLLTSRWQRRCSTSCNNYSSRQTCGPARSAFVENLVIDVFEWARTSDPCRRRSMRRAEPRLASNQSASWSALMQPAKSSTSFYLS